MLTNNKSLVAVCITAMTGYETVYYDGHFYIKQKWISPTRKIVVQGYTNADWHETLIIDLEKGAIGRHITFHHPKKNQPKHIFFNPP
jgi:hypothetical protein